MNEILLRRKNKVILGTGTARVANDRYITAIMKNIEELGYTFSREVFDVLRTYSVNELSDFYFELKATLMKLKGANVVYMLLCICLCMPISLRALWMHIFLSCI